MTLNRKHIELLSKILFPKQSPKYRYLAGSFPSVHSAVQEATYQVPNWVTQNPREIISAKLVLILNNKDNK